MHTSPFTEKNCIYLAESWFSADSQPTAVPYWKENISLFQNVNLSHLVRGISNWSLWWYNFRQYQCLNRVHAAGLVLSDTYHRSQISVCLHGSLVAEKFTNKIIPSNYKSEATENTIFAQNPPSVFFIRAYSASKK